MAFLGSLGDAIAGQFNLVSNNSSSLGSVVDGQNSKYSSLGDLSSRFDQSAERKYLESGYLRVDPYHTDPRSFEVIWQQPSATILVKKKMYSSIAENYRPDHMDANEQFYYKAMSLLFQNKCNQIAALERLSKIQKITAAVGNISEQLIPIIITLSDQLNNGYASNPNSNTGLFSSSNTNSLMDQDINFFQIVDRLRTLYSYNRTSDYTDWITDPNDIFQSTFGPGTGVIEITNFTNITTNTSIDINQPGNFSFSISDPYQSMLITDYDIELALSDASNSFYNHKSIQLSGVAANDSITFLQNQLNGIRASRNASPISFNINPNTIFGQPVTAIIDRLGVEIPFTYNSLGSLVSAGLGKSVNVTSDYLRGGNIAGYDGLDTGTVSVNSTSTVKPLFGNSEETLFSSIINAIYQQLLLLSSTSTNAVNNNKSSNDARRKLRFSFSGQLIIQPMDSVHIYINTKSQYDNKILAGLQQMFSGNGILGNVNSMINSVVNSASTLLNPSGNLQLQVEKDVYVGSEFPNYLWSLIRSQFVTEIEGTHVMAGLVNNAVDNWSDGKFIVSVTGDDNTVYFRQGKINFKPGVDAFNGLIFDPLTPFVSNWDSFTGNADSAVTSQNSSNSPTLLNENKQLIAQVPQDSLVKFKQGALFGQKVTQGNYILDQITNPATGRLTKTMYAPDGLVYKWKQGIGIFARSGNISTINSPGLVGNPTIYKEPFAGLDVMNVLSLLITGTPYNYMTYLKATGSINSFSTDPNSKQSGTKTFLDSLRNDLSKNNLLWGNFVPFKSLVMNQAAVAFALQGQLTATSVNSDLDNKLNKLSILNNALVSLGAGNFLSKTSNAQFAAEVQSQIQNLRVQSQQLQNSINSSIASFQQASSQAASQIVTTPSYINGGSSSNATDYNDTRLQKKIRQEINYLTRRMSYDVRGNVDKNLLIVDDYYDTDYDIAAFNTSLDSLKLFSNDYISVLDKIKQIADLLNLEVFADSQGHIRVRPPQYNKMPSSIFYRMLHLQQTSGIQVFPQFLNNLFTNQIKALSTQIEITEDYIRLLCVILGKYTTSTLSTEGDDAVAQFISGSGATTGSSTVFSFLSDYTDTITDYNTLIQQANQDLSAPDTSLNNYTTIKDSATSTAQPFSNAQRYQILQNALSIQNNAQGGFNTNVPSTNIFQNSIVQALFNRIYGKSGQTVSSMDYITSSVPNQPLGIDTGQTVDIFKVTNDLTSYINKWQNQVKLFYHTIKNAAEFKSFDQDKSKSNKLGVPGVFGNSNIPEVYEHMIEDENFDDYGLGSGSRYIIRTEQIKQVSIRNEPPPWTTVEVHGSLSPIFDPTTGGGGPAGFFELPGGGNGVVSAIAIDYDMWRFYGFKEPHVVNVPFLSDPVSQCGPYAAMILTRNRSNILQGTITISGNEYMQVGEVIYLEDRNLLFYVKSVKHNYIEGQSFTTTLDLNYGHSIGDYIPTYLDTIGKVIFKNQSSVDVIVQRQDSSGNEKNLGIVQLDGKNPTANILYTGTEDSTINGYSSTNQTVLNNVIYSAYNLINANGTPGNNVTAAVELRIYYDNNNAVDSNLNTAAMNVANYLMGKNQGPLKLPTAGPPGAISPLYLKSATVSTVNIDNTKDPRSPSQQAISAARSQMQNVSVNSGSPSLSNPQNGNTGTSATTQNPSNQNLRTALYKYVVDCWLTFTPISTTVASRSTSNPVDGGT